MPRRELPENPYTRMMIRTKVDLYLKDIPEDEPITSNHPDAKKRQAFVRYTGLNQATLESWWSRGKNLTSCNGFAGIYANAIVPPPKKGQRMFGMFDLARACRMYGAPDAWIKQSDDPNARPGYGDIVKWTRLHLSVSLEIQGMQWHVVQGGQGGRSTGFDAVRRHWMPYEPDKIEGWVSLVTLFDMHL